MLDSEVMAETGTSSPNGPAESFTSVRTLRRVRQGEDGRIVGGLAGGLGRYFDVDPVIFRVLFGALTFVGGLGFGLYILGYLLIPAEGEPDSRLSAAARRVTHRSPWLLWVGIGLLVWIASADAHFFFGGHDFFVTPILLIVLLVLFINRRGAGRLRSDHRRERWHHHRAQAEAQAAAAVAYGEKAAADATAYADEAVRTAGFTNPPRSPFGDIPASPDVAPAWTPRPRRKPSKALAPTVVAVIASWVVLAVLAVGGAITLSPVSIAATTLLVITAGLVASAIVGRSWLLILAELLAVGAFVVTIPLPHDLGWTVSSQSFAPVTIDRLPREVKLLAGEAGINLTKTQGLQGRTVRATIGAGRMTVDVPNNLPILLKAHAGAGQITVDGKDYNSWDGVSINREDRIEGTNAKLLPVTLDLEVGYGEILIRHVDPKTGYTGTSFSGPNPGDYSPVEPTPTPEPSVSEEPAPSEG